MNTDRFRPFRAYAIFIQKRWPFIWATRLHWLPLVWVALAVLSALLLLTPYGADYVWPDSAEELPGNWEDVFPFAANAGHALVAAPGFLFLLWLPLMRYRWADTGFSKGTSAESWKRLGAIILLWAPVVLICAATVKLNNDAMRAVFREALLARDFDPSEHLPYKWSLAQPLEMLAGYFGSLPPAAMCAFALTRVKFWEFLLAAGASYLSVMAVIIFGMSLIGFTDARAPELFAAVYGLAVLGFCIYGLTAYRARPFSRFNLARGPKYITGKYVVLSMLTIVLCGTSFSATMLLMEWLRFHDIFALSFALYFVFSSAGFALAFHLFQKNLSLLGALPKD